MKCNPQKEKAIFDFYLGGHHIEYLHHIYMYAIEDVETYYIFILPNNFERFGKQMLWPKAENVRFVFYELDDKYVRSLGAYEKSRTLSKLLRKYADLTGIKEFVLIETMVFMPYLPLYAGREVKITSIVYHLELYSKIHRFWGIRSIKAKLYNNLMMCLLAMSSCFNKVCLLNSHEAVDYYNKKLCTSKFSYLPDPYVPIACIKDKEQIYKKLGIDSSMEVFFHFGGLVKRKGTLDILDTLILTEEKFLKGKCFIFAGRVIESIKDEFYQKIEEVKHKVKVVVFDEFCEYSLFAEVCKIASYILIPYKNTSQSSGVCSYAAQFKVPVIGPSEGVLGKIIEKNQLGVTIKDISVDKLVQLFQNKEYKNAFIDNEAADAYLEGNTPKIFSECLMEL